MHFLIDECVTRAVYDMLVAKGARVDRTVDVLGSGTKDRDIVAYGDSIGAIVIDANAKDFRKLVARQPANNNLTFRHVSRISFCCKPKNEPLRLERAMPFIALDWQQRQKSTDKRIIFELSDTSITIFP